MNWRAWWIGAICCVPHAWLAVSFGVGYDLSPMWIVDYYAWAFSDVRRTLMAAPGILWMLVFIVRSEPQFEVTD